MAEVPAIDLLVIAALVLMGAAYLMLGALWAIPVTQGFSKTLRPALLSTTVVVGLIMAGFWVGGWLLTGLLVALGLRIGWEAGAVIGLPAVPVGLVLAAMTAIAMLVPWGGSFPIWVVGLWALSLGVYLLRRDQKLALWLVFPALPFVCLSFGAARADMAALVLLAFIMSETFDSCAYLAGKAFGRCKAFPTLSPNKTVEGLVGGGVMLCATAVLLAWVLALELLPALGFACLAGVLTLGGDLTASWIKRRGGVKDFPVLNASQGGALDTVDAWVATAGGVVVLVAFLGQL